MSAADAIRAREDAKKPKPKKWQRPVTLRLSHDEIKPLSVAEQEAAREWAVGVLPVVSEPE